MICEARQARLETLLIGHGFKKKRARRTVTTVVKEAEFLATVGVHGTEILERISESIMDLVPRVVDLRVNQNRLVYELEEWASQASSHQTTVSYQE